MDITNQQWHKDVTIKMSTSELLELKEELVYLNGYGINKATLQFFNSKGEQFDLNLVIDDSDD